MRLSTPPEAARLLKVTVWSPALELIAAGLLISTPSSSPLLKRTLLFADCEEPGICIESSMTGGERTRSFFGSLFPRTNPRFKSVNAPATTAIGTPAADSSTAGSAIRPDDVAICVPAASEPLSSDFLAGGDAIAGGASLKPRIPRGCAVGLTTVRFRADCGSTVRPYELDENARVNGAGSGLLAEGFSGEMPLLTAFAPALPCGASLA